MEKICSQCNSPKYYAKGFCKSCYRKQFIPKRWSKKFSACIKCGTNQVPHVAHGLCRKCYMSTESNTFCACGCGLFTTIYRGKPRKFRRGHWMRTQSEQDKFWKNSRLSTQGENNPCYGKFGKDHPAYKHHTTEETRKLRREVRIRELSKRKTSPTDIEIILLNILNDLKIIHKPQYPINKKFVVDEFIPQHNLIIEAFGGYWHGDPRRFSESSLSKIQLNNMKKDSSRTKYLKKCGYRILILWEKDLKERPEWCKKEILRSIKNQLIPQT